MISRKYLLISSHWALMINKLVIRVTDKDSEFKSILRFCSDNPVIRVLHDRNRLNILNRNNTKFNVIPSPIRMDSVLEAKCVFINYSCHFGFPQLNCWDTLRLNEYGFADDKIATGSPFLSWGIFFSWVRTTQYLVRLTLTLLFKITETTTQIGFTTTKNIYINKTHTYIHM